MPANNWVGNAVWGIFGLVGSVVLYGGNFINHIIVYADSDTPSQAKAKVDENTKAVECSSSWWLHNPVSMFDLRSYVSPILPNFKSRGKRSKRARARTRTRTGAEQKHYGIHSFSLDKKSTSRKKVPLQPYANNDQLAMETTTLFDSSVSTRKCSHCQVTNTPQWREGPNGPKTLCNACGVRYRSGRLLPEYRPAASPSFTPLLHSNSHKKVVEMRKNNVHETLVEEDPPTPPPTPPPPPPRCRKNVLDVLGLAFMKEEIDSGGDPPRSPEVELIETIPIIGHPFDIIY